MSSSYVPRPATAFSLYETLAARTYHNFDRIAQLNTSAIQKRDYVHWQLVGARLQNVRLGLPHHALASTRSNRTPLRQFLWDATKILQAFRQHKCLY